MIVNTLPLAYELIGEQSHAEVAGVVARHVLKAWRLDTRIVEHMTPPLFEVVAPAVTASPAAAPVWIIEDAPDAPDAPWAGPSRTASTHTLGYVDESRALGRWIETGHWQRAQVAAAYTGQDAEAVFFAMHWCECLAFVLCRRLGSVGEWVDFARGPDGVRYAARRRADGAHEVTPWPFDMPELTLHCATWRLPRTLPNDETTLVAALPRAALIPQTWTLTRPT